MALKQAIKIPSKNIYQLQNQKVIDNQVDNIEVNLVAPSVKYEIENISNKRIEAKNFTNSLRGQLTYGHGTNNLLIAKEDNSVLKKTIPPAAQGGVSYNIELGAYCGIAGYFVYIDNITIPKKLLSNKFVSSIGKDAISHYFEYEIHEGTVSFDFITNDRVSVNVTYSQAYTVSSSPISNEVSAVVSIDDPSDVTNKLKVSAEVNVEDDFTKISYRDYSVEETDNSFVLNVKKCAFYGIGEVISFTTSRLVEGGARTNDYNAKRYIPKTLVLNISGEVVRIDLENVNYSIGNGNNIISLNGNELMQLSPKEYDIELEKQDNSTFVYNMVTDTDIKVIGGDKVEYDGHTYEVATVNGDKITFTEQISTEEFIGSLKRDFNNNYYDIVTDWKDGKEVATIRCSIDDYYTDKPFTHTIYKTLDIFAYKYYPQTPSNPSSPMILEFYSNAIEFGESNFVTFVCKQKQGGLGEFSIKVIKSEQPNNPPFKGVFIGGTITPQVGQDYSASYNYEDTTIKKVISPNDKNIPMSFHIGDVVIPYVRGANGQDKPMSRHLDGSAKEFNVLGKRMISDGGVWQQLTLQEKTE